VTTTAALRSDELTVTNSSSKSFGWESDTDTEHRACGAVVVVGGGAVVVVGGATVVVVGGVAVVVGGGAVVVVGGRRVVGGGRVVGGAVVVDGGNGGEVVGAAPGEVVGGIVGTLFATVVVVVVPTVTGGMTGLLGDGGTGPARATVVVVDPGPPGNRPRVDVGTFWTSSELVDLAESAIPVDPDEPVGPRDVVDAPPIPEDRSSERPRTSVPIVSSPSRTTDHATMATTSTRGTTTHAARGTRARMAAAPDRTGDGRAGVAGAAAR
jgi:hypothetical protein